MDHFGLDERKTDIIVGEQRRRPVCPSAQSGQHLCYSLPAKYIQTCIGQNFNILGTCSWTQGWKHICTVWSAPLLFTPWKVYLNLHQAKFQYFPNSDLKLAECPLNIHNLKFVWSIVFGQIQYESENLCQSPLFSILRLTFYGKSASKSWIQE